MAGVWLFKVESLWHIIKTRALSGLNFASTSKPELFTSCLLPLFTKATILISHSGDTKLRGALPVKKLRLL